MATTTTETPGLKKERGFERTFSVMKKSIRHRFTGPRFERIMDRMRAGILLMDGGMGTCLQQAHLKAEDFGGEELDGCNENLNLTRPDVIQDIHEQYYRAGSDIVETNSFGGTPLVLGEYELQEKFFEINFAAAQNARKAAQKVGGDRFVAGSMGPTTKAISVTGGVTIEDLIHNYRQQALGLIEGGCDFLLLETAQDTINLKCGVAGILQALEHLDTSIPLMVSVTIEPTGTMLAGQGVEAVATALSHLPLLGIGMNCSTGPEFMTSHVRALSQLVSVPILCMPNAGLPNEDGKYVETPQDMAVHLAKFADSGWLNLMGGCCGTSPAYIEHFHDLRKQFRPRMIQGRRGTFVSGIDFVEVDEDTRPLLVGERTNIIGSRKFKQLIVDGRLEEAAEIGRKQVRKGAQIVDVCLANPDRDEMADLKAFLPELMKKIRVPVMVDSTDDACFEEALKMLPGKCILNSINLETGEDRFETVSGLLKLYGGSVVVGCIDEDPHHGMAVSRERKLEVAARSYELLTQKYGIQEEDIIWDPLVFPCGTGDENYITSAKETVEGIRLIKEKYPKTKTILGISNVSFGLPEAGREMLNSVFLYHCTKAGLDMAIVNSEKIERYANIGQRERELCEGMIFDNSQERLDEFVAHFRQMKTLKSADEKADWTVEDRLIANLVEGSKEGLIPNLEEALQKYDPLDVINGPLMAGMNKVGKLFNANELIVAEVLQSASVMKAAVAHLEPSMEKTSDACKAKVLLATVKGDVHDIGKNLVEIILANNGYEVINLGIKIAPEVIIEAWREHKPDFIGLSGLLVKSALQMVDTVEDLKAAGVDCPILVGGAALSRRFTDTRIAPKYAAPVLYSVDAMTGLEIANNLVDPKLRDTYLKEYEDKAASLREGGEPKVSRPSSKRSKLVLSHEALREAAPDLERHVVKFDVAEVWPYLNEQFFYAQHLGFKGSIRLSLQKGEEKAAKLHRQVEELKRLAEKEGWIEPVGVYRFFEAESQGNDLKIHGANGELLETIHFPRQKDGEELCAADFVASHRKDRRDTIAMFAVSTGYGVREASARFKEAGDYFSFHALQALAVEAAEATAEMLHQKIRGLWGIQEDLSFKDLVQTRYQGIRLSFGYPACPDLEDQRLLFRLLKPQDVGIELTENMMMEPEGSVSALVFSHPDAKYFSVQE